MNIIFFVAGDDEAVEVWADQQHVPRLGDKVVPRDDMDVCEVLQVVWISESTVEITIK